MDTFMHWLSLAFPAVFLFGGIFSLIAAVTGWRRIYEDSKNPQMQAQLAQLGKKKARILHAAGGIIMAAFGGYLLYCWLFGPVRH